MANQSNYWDQRTLELQNSIALHEQALFQNLRQYYNKEAAELDQDIAAYYSKYGTNNVIQYRNLLQSLSDADKQLLYEKIQDFEKQYPQYAHLMSVRESIYKLDRLEGLRTSVAIQQLKMGAYEIAQAQAHFQQMALLAGNLIAEQMGYGSSFYRIDSDMLRMVVGQDWCNNQDFSARIWHNRNALTQTLQTQIVNGMIRGDSYKAISKSVQNKFQTVSQRNIERLVFTEDTFLANEAAMQTYLNDPDYAYYEYVALCDGKTCDLCASLTGERFRISERRPGVNFPPMHPWCRCFFDIVHEKNSGKYTERNSENPRNRRQTGLTASRKNGTIKVPETLAGYEKAKEAYMKKIQDTEIMKPENREAVEKVLKTLLDEGDFCVRIRESVLNTISNSDDKRFKNQMETQSSMGAYNPEIRKKASETLFGVDPSQLQNRAFEKYGFLAGKDKALSFADEEAADYGKIIVQFNRNKLFDRTTFTVGDSLNNISNNSSLFAGKVSEPSVCAVPQDDFTKKIIEASVKFNNGLIKNHIEFCQHAMVEYIELQYHGDLSLDDVEVVYYQESIDPDLKLKLEKLGIKVVKIES
ncbi:MAG: minor capsid protein [Oscillospiraceae bacterium]|nr:minor capsid protein [Oscillospiraceae bacterium]